MILGSMVFLLFFFCTIYCPMATKKCQDIIRKACAAPFPEANCGCGCRVRWGLKYEWRGKKVRSKERMGTMIPHFHHSLKPPPFFNLTSLFLLHPHPLPQPPTLHTNRPSLCIIPAHRILYTSSLCPVLLLFSISWKHHLHLHVCTFLYIFLCRYNIIYRICTLRKIIIFHSNNIDLLI